jgi:hypothetical protein
VWALVLKFAKKYAADIFQFLAITGAFVALWYSARKQGEAKAEVKAASEKAADREAVAVRQVNETREAARVEVETVRNANEVQDKNATIPDAAVIVELRSKWSRD